MSTDIDEQPTRGPAPVEADHSPLTSSSTGGAIVTGGIWSHPVVRGLKWLGLRLLWGMETVGEVVANVLGLNESKYQYVIDQMSEEDWKVAREVHAKKLQEEAARKTGGGDVEAAGETMDERVERMTPHFLVMQEKM